MGATTISGFQICQVVLCKASGNGKQGIPCSWSHQGRPIFVMVGRVWRDFRFDFSLNFVFFAFYTINEIPE